MSDFISRKYLFKHYQNVCKYVACCECKAKEDDGSCSLEKLIIDAPAVNTEPYKESDTE